MPRHRYDALTEDREHLAALCVEPLESTQTSSNAESMHRGTQYRQALSHLDTLREAAEAGSTALFVDHVAWARTLRETSGLSIDELRRELEMLDRVAGDAVSPPAAAVTHDIIGAGLDSLARPLATPPSFFESREATLAQRFLHGLIEGNREGAIRLVLDAVESGKTIEEIYLDVFVPVLHEVGRLWQIGSIDVGLEHYCTAAVQLSMSLLYPKVFATERIGRTLVAGCVGEELHEIGVRMVADFFELAGWSTHYLGANVPDDALVTRARATGADVVAISVSITPHLRRARQAIAALRRATDTKILVGGYPLSVAPDLWRQIEADGTAPDGPSAVREAHRLVELAGAKD